MELTEIVQGMKDREFSGCGTPGCGPLLGLRLLSQNMGKFVLVGTPGCVSVSGMTSVNIGFNAPAAADALSRAAKDLVVAYASSAATGMHISSLISACGRGRFLYVCYNTSIGCHFEESIIKSVAPYARYAATASLAYPEDFMEKLRKAAAMEGLRYIELFAPCPTAGFDTSNTIEVARIATDCALWPVFEVDRKVTLTKRPLHIEPVSAYFSLLKKDLKSDEMQKVQERTNRNWKSLTEGKLI